MGYFDIAGLEDTFREAHRMLMREAENVAGVHAGEDHGDLTLLAESRFADFYVSGYARRVGPGDIDLECSYTLHWPLEIPPSTEEEIWPEWGELPWTGARET